MTVEEAYRRWLFHGPGFQCISRSRESASRGSSPLCAPSSVQRCLADSPAGSWLVDPIVVDAAPQLAILWARANWDVTALPSRFGAYRRYGGTTRSSLTCHFTVMPGAEEQGFQAEAWFVNPEGCVVVGALEGLEFTCSASLNRLTGSPQDTGGQAP